MSPGQALSKQGLNGPSQKSPVSNHQLGTWAAVPDEYLRTFKPTRQAGFDLSYIIRCWHKLSISGAEAGLAYNELLVNRERLQEYLYELTRAVDVQEQYYGSCERINALHDSFYTVLPNSQLLENMGELQAHYQSICQLTARAREISKEPVYLPSFTRCSRSQFSRFRDAAPDIKRWSKLMQLLGICNDAEFTAYVKKVRDATGVSTGKLQLAIALGIELLPDESDFSDQENDQEQSVQPLVKLMDKQIVATLVKLDITPRRTQQDTLSFMEYEWLQPARGRDDDIVKIPLFSKQLRSYIPTAPGYTPGVMADRLHAIRKPLDSPRQWMRDFYAQQTAGEYPPDVTPSQQQPSAEPQKKKRQKSTKKELASEKPSAQETIASQPEAVPKLSQQEYVARMKSFRKQLAPAPPLAAQVVRMSKEAAPIVNTTPPEEPSDGFDVKDAAVFPSPQKEPAPAEEPPKPIEAPAENPIAQLKESVVSDVGFDIELDQNPVEEPRKVVQAEEPPQKEPVQDPAEQTAVEPDTKAPEVISMEIESEHKEEPAPQNEVENPPAAVAATLADTVELDLDQPKDEGKKELIPEPPKVVEEPASEPFSLANQMYVTLLSACPEDQNAKKFIVNKLDVELRQSQLPVKEAVKDHVSAALQIELEPAKREHPVVPAVKAPEGDGQVEILL